MSQAGFTVDDVAHSIAVAALRRGDIITEIDTPEGPWHLVHRVDLEGHVIVLHDGVEIEMASRFARVLRHHEQGLGVFEARSVRDHASLSRDGHPIVEINEVASVTAIAFEVRFPDGDWLLATAHDVVALTPA